MCNARTTPRPPIRIIIEGWVVITDPVSSFGVNHSYFPILQLSGMLH